MLVDKNRFKELKKADGGSLGFECSAVAEILEAEDLKKVDTCNISIHPKGLYMDFLLSYKLYFPLENLQQVKLNNGIIEIYIESELPIKIKIEKIKDAVKVYNTLKTHLGEENEQINSKDYMKAKLGIQEYEEETTIQRRSKDKEELNAAWNDLKTTWNQCPLKDMSINQTSHNEDDNNVARCPKCGSTSLTGNKKGFSATKGVLGLAVSPLAGAIVGSTGKNKVIVTCLKCGHHWKAGKK
ncbi:hypothetical protein [Clostridium cadaveris]|uniref:hypothetical protein n=1 Tax=Clostridium cadaveris TaxID=1529 RepID=UPI0003FB86F8|nr:hypothetical protein [Clostridium cadaveris]